MEINDSALWYGLDEKSSKKAPKNSKEKPMCQYQELGNECMFIYVR